MKVYSSKELIKMIEADGWTLTRVRGSHHQFRHPIKKGTTTVTHPKKDMDIRTANSVLKQAGLK